MKVLLDTHIFLWLHSERKRLGEHLSLLEDPQTELIFSAASSWEIAIKYALGRLPLPEPPQRYVPSRMRAIGAIALPIEHSHALAVAALPPLHGDPFDRLLIAQGQLLDVTIVTADAIIAQVPGSCAARWGRQRRSIARRRTPIASAFNRGGLPADRALDLRALGREPPHVGLAAQRADPAVLDQTEVLQAREQLRDLALV